MTVERGSQTFAAILVAKMFSTRRGDQKGCTLVRCLRCEEPFTMACREKTLSRIQNTFHNANISRHSISGKVFWIVGHALDSGKCFDLRNTVTTPGEVRRGWHEDRQYVQSLIYFPSLDNYRCLTEWTFN